MRIVTQCNGDPLAAHAKPKLNRLAKSSTPFGSTSLIASFVYLFILIIISMKSLSIMMAVVAAAAAAAHWLVALMPNHKI